MKILFVNPPNPPDGYIYIRDLNRSGRRSKERTIWPQTSLALCAAMFPEDDVKILDCVAEDKNYAWLEKTFESERPDWVVFNSISSTLTNDMLTAFYAKKYHARTATVGAHIKALGDPTRKRFPCLDDAIPGEPEIKLRNLIHSEENPQKPLDELPYARHDLLPMEKHRLPFIGDGYSFIHTSRGCPWECIYCRQTVTWDGRRRGVQYRSPQKVAEEIKSYRLKNIIFHADTSTVNKKQLLELCALLEPLKIRWCANSRVDTIDRERLRAMKRAGCWMVMYGMESGNDAVLALNKKQATVEQAIDAAYWTQEAGIKVWGYFMLGMYGDTPQTMQETINLSLQLPLDIVNFAVAAPYPGTEWGRLASENSWIVDDRWEAMDQNYSAIVDQPGCSAAEVSRFQKKAYFSWYGRPYGLGKMLSAYRMKDTVFWLKMLRDHLKFEESKAS